MSVAPPSGWREARVEDLGEVLAGRQRSPNQPGTPKPYLRVANVLDGCIDTADVLEMPFTEGEYDRFRLLPGDVLVNEGQSRELVGRSAVYRGNPPDCCFQNTIIRFRAGPETHAEFAHQLFAWLQRGGKFSEIATQTTSIAHLGVKRFAQFVVRVPGLEEQRDIAATLKVVEDATAAGEALVEHLDRLRRDLREVLTSGPHATKTEEVPVRELLVDGPRNGLYKPADKIGSGSLITGMTAIQHEGIDWKLCRRAETTADELDRFGLHEDDLLVTRVYARIDGVGRFIRVAEPPEPAVYESNMMRIRVRRDRVLPQYLAAAMASRGGREQVEQRVTLAAQASLNSESLRSIRVRLPPMAKQRQAVAVLDAIRARMACEIACLEERRRLKASLADALLSGRLRVRDAA